MKKRAKKTLLLLFLAATALLAGVYFLFPGLTFELLLMAERRAGGLSQHTIDVDGVHVEYLQGGRGDALVLLHGFGADKDNWTRIGRHLTPHFRVVAPDLPGFGESGPAPDGNYTVKAQVARVRAFVRAMGIERFHLEKLLDGLAVPTLVVWGTRDRVLDPSGAEILASVIPGARVAMMDAVGHLPMIEKPKETADLMMRFLQPASGSYQ